MTTCLLFVLILFFVYHQFIKLEVIVFLTSINLHLLYLFFRLLLRELSIPAPTATSIAIPKGRLSKAVPNATPKHKPIAIYIMTPP